MSIEHSPDRIGRFLKVRYPLDRLSKNIWEADDRPAIDKILEALSRLPAVQQKASETRWKKILDYEYSHLIYCTVIGMALCDYSALCDNEDLLLPAYTKWLRKDKHNFVSDEDVHLKWKSFKDVENPVYYQILLILSHVGTFEYPKPMYKKERWGSSPIPESPATTEYDNFEYILEYYDISIYHGSNGYYLTGYDHDLMDVYFAPYCGRILNKYYGPLSEKSLHLALLVLLQNCNWQCSTVKTLLDIKINQKLPVLSLSLSREWLDTPFDDLSDEYKHITIGSKNVNVREFDSVSTVDNLFDCIHTTYTEENEIQLAKTMLRKTLMYMMSFIEPVPSSFTEHAGMFVLIGAENTDKSAFFKLLLPQPLAHLRKEINLQFGTEKVLRDLPKALSSNLMVQLDEFEVLMNHKKYGSLFQTMLTSGSAGFADIRQTQEHPYERCAVIVGTANELRQRISANGSRHMWIVRVKKIDIDRMRMINLHTLYNNLREEFRQELDSGKVPWLLDQQDIDLLNEMNRAIAIENEPLLWLQELWPIQENFNESMYGRLKDIKITTDHLLTTKQLQTVLTDNGAPQFLLEDLIRALEEHCGAYTDTLYGEKIIYNRSNVPKGVIIKGRFCHNLLKSGTYNYMKWIMPHKADNI